MRKLHAILARFLAGLFCLALNACFDIREEVWIRRNGSGHAELNYTVPESALFLAGGKGGLEKKIRELVATQPKIRLDGLSVTVAGEQAKVAVSLSTDSMLSLLDLKKSKSFEDLPESAINIAGNFDVRLKGLDIDFTRTVRVRDALGLASLAVGAEERANRHLSYIVHLPKAAKETNATTVEDGGKTLIWNLTLGEAMKKPVVTSFRAEMPIPRFVWAAAGALLLGIAAVIWRIRILRRRRAEDACMVDL